MESFSGVGCKVYFFYLKLTSRDWRGLLMTGELNSGEQDAPITYPQRFNRLPGKQLEIDLPSLELKKKKKTPHGNTWNDPERDKQVAISTFTWELCI